MSDVVIVGAGPVGLWIATQIKKRRPSRDVQIYERHTEYQRSHVLQLEYMSMLIYAKKARDNDEKDFFEAVTGTRSLTKLVQGSTVGESIFIRTNELEAALKNHAKALGVKITHKKIETPEEIEALHPECNIFIAADGAHSLMRNALMGKDATKEYPLQHVVEVKLEVKGNAKKLSIMNAHKLNTRSSNVIFEFVGRAKDKVTPITLRLFTDKDTYDAMPEATFKNPLQIDDDKLPAKIAKDIQAYLDFRKAVCVSPGKITKLVLALYRAKKFAMTSGMRGWFLAGDAAMGVPYFRSLNAGMIIGSQLSFILTRNFISTSTKTKMYKACSPLDTAWEFTGAYSKDWAIKVYDMIRKM